jgi:hypothetical protein
MFAGMAVAASLQSVLGKKATAKDTAALVALWGLERKLQDLLLNRGIPVAATSVPLKTMVVTLPFLDLLSQLKEADTSKLDIKAVKKVAGIMVDTIVHNKEASVVAGVNLFDNVLWFNQELMSEALWYAIAVPAFIGSGLDESTKEGLETVAKTLATAQKKAEYQADQLCELLPPPEVKKPKSSKSSSKEKANSVKKTVQSTETTETDETESSNVQAEKKVDTSDAKKLEK